MNFFQQRIQSLRMVLPGFFQDPSPNLQTPNSRGGLDLTSPQAQIQDSRLRDLTHCHNHQLNYHQSISQPPPPLRWGLAVGPQVRPLFPVGTIGDLPHPAEKDRVGRVILVGLEGKVLNPRGLAEGVIHNPRGKAKARMARKARGRERVGGRPREARAFFSRGFQPLAETTPHSILCLLSPLPPPLPFLYRRYHIPHCLLRAPGPGLKRGSQKGQGGRRPTHPGRHASASPEKSVFQLTARPVPKTRLKRAHQGPGGRRPTQLGRHASATPGKIVHQAKAQQSLFSQVTSSPGHHRRGGRRPPALPSMALCLPKAGCRSSPLILPLPIHILASVTIVHQIFLQKFQVLPCHDFSLKRKNAEKA